MSRDVTIRIKAEISGLRNGLRAAQTNLASFNKEVQASAAKRAEINKLGTTFGRIGLIAAAGAAVAVKSFADFDQAMSGVKATGKDAANNINALRQASIDAGAATKYSATEAANGVEDLAKAGISAADILGGGLSGSLALAAAGQIGVADAAQFAAIAMTQFKLQGKDIPHVADLLAAGAGKANGEVADLGMALNQAGLIAKQTGLSIEETTGTLAAFASAGLLGSDAGTSFKTMLQSLTPGSKNAKAAIDKYNISAYDAQGNFIGMTKFAGKLHDGLKNLTKEQRNAALKTIFGSDAIRAASVLYDQGAKGIENWTNKVNDQGYAAETAATKMDNLKGDWEQLTGSLQTALIGLGSGANGPLRGLLQEITGLVNGFNDLPAPIQGATLKFLALTAALGGGVFVATRVITGYANLKNSLDTLGVSTGNLGKKQLLMRGGLALGGVALLSFSDQIGKTNKTAGELSTILGAGLAGSVFGPWGAAAGVAGASVKLFAEANHVAAPDVDSLTVSLDKQTGALTANSKAQVVAALQKNGTFKTGRTAGVTPGQITDAALGSTKALAQIIALRTAAKEAYGAAVRAGTASSGPDYQAQVAALDAVINAITGQNDAVDASVQKWKDAQAAQSGSIELNRLSAAQIAAVGDAVKGIPKEALTKFTTPGYKDAVKNAAAVAHQYKLNPKEVRTSLKLLGFSTKQIDAVIAAMKTLDGKDAKPKIKPPKDNASPKLKTAGDKVDALNKKSARPTIKAPKDNATKPIKGIIALIGGLGKNPKTPKAGINDKATKPVKGLISLVGGFGKQKPNAKLSVSDKASSTTRSAIKLLNSYDGRNAHSTITTTYKTIGRPGVATGGIIPRGFAGGGKVPGTSPADPSVDNVTGVGNGGRQFGIRSGEWVINGPQSKKNDRWLRAVNNGLDMNKIMPGYANGGVVGGSGSGDGGQVYARLVDPTVRIAKNGLLELMDDRVAIGIGSHARHQAATAGRRRS